MANNDLKQILADGIIRFYKEVFNQACSVDWTDFDSTLTVKLSSKDLPAITLPLNDGYNTSFAEIKNYLQAERKDRINLTRAEQLSPERGRTHGDFKENGVIAETVREFWHTRPGWETLRAHQKLALNEIALKVARVLSGGQQVKEHWDDIEGYAKLGGQDCV